MTTAVTMLAAQQQAENLQALRALMLERGAQAFCVPRADEFLGEYIPAHNERLRWLTSFTGSAGMAVVLAERGGNIYRWTLYGTGTPSGGCVPLPVSAPDRGAAASVVVGAARPPGQKYWWIHVCARCAGMKMRSAFSPKRVSNW
jgi:hypothetical protein